MAYNVFFFIYVIFRLRSDLYRCNLYWEDDRTLLIGWANSVKVCQVVPLDGAKAVAVSSKDQLGPPRFFVKISKYFDSSSPKHRKVII